ncbi:hypothetical protein BJ878DRAFT_114307 [Calycina marina]|uniref:Uncharacterized protein n=1 Tax=Calycina marina TaxID=1763456 RepID=A0A9P8CFN7_9HELO|nr:hypothetical protein BJ878DRAFT_114307 [Calycina marina]
MYLLHEKRTLTLLGGADPAPTTSSAVSSTLPTVTSISLIVTGNPSSVTAVSAPTDTASTTSKAAENSSSTGPNTKLIVGVSIGVVILVALIAFGIWFCLKKRRSQSRAARGSSVTPMLGVNGVEKWAMDNSPDDLGQERRSITVLSRGVFDPFGGYHRTPTVPFLEPESGRSMDIGRAYDAPEAHDEARDEAHDEMVDDYPYPRYEKTRLEPPPEHSHPAYHPLPGQSREIPTYYPGGIHPEQPPYTLKSLPSQRNVYSRSVALPSQKVASKSPELPDLLFSPIDLVRGVEMSDVMPITPQAELAAFPSPPTTIPSSVKTALKKPLQRSLTPPQRAQKPQRPRRQIIPPRHAAPLNRLTPYDNIPSPAAKAETIKLKKERGLKISGLRPEVNNTTDTRPTENRPRLQTYPSPTAGGRPELPASSPPPKRAPAFNHISLPSPIPSSPMQIRYLTRNESTATSGTYSIPVGLASTVTRQESLKNWPRSINNNPVTSDAHHLRNQSSAISALSAVRDLHNSSAVSALSVVPSQTLKHNHSRDLSAHSEHAHVMSWQDYQGEGEGEPENSEISPMFSPQSTGPHMHNNNAVVSPMTIGERTPGQGSSGFSTLVGTRTPSQLRGMKTPSQQSLWAREREREDYFGDLSVQPLSMGRRWEGLRKKTLGGGARKKRIPSEQLLNGGEY